MQTDHRKMPRRRVRREWRRWTWKRFATRFSGKYPPLRVLFGWTAVERERNKDDEDSFSLHMAKQLLSTFGTVTGTLGSFKRSSPSNIDFAKTFLDDYNEGFSPAWKSLLDTIDGLLLWIESETFAAADLEGKIKELKPELALVNSDI
jgi:hypothetical protein